MKRDLGRSAAGLLACLLVQGDCLAAGLSGVGRADPELKLKVVEAAAGLVHAGVNWGWGGGVAADGLQVASGCGDMSMGEKGVLCKHRDDVVCRPEGQQSALTCLNTLCTGIMHC